MSDNADEDTSSPAHAAQSAPAKGAVVKPRPAGSDDSDLRDLGNDPKKIGLEEPDPSTLSDQADEAAPGTQVWNYPDEGAFSANGVRSFIQEWRAGQNKSANTYIIDIKGNPARYATNWSTTPTVLGWASAINAMKRLSRPTRSPQAMVG